MFTIIFWKEGGSNIKCLKFEQKIVQNKQHGLK